MEGEARAGTRPLVSVGLPTFNRVGTLSRAIESVLSQSYDNLELVLSDNASTDGTAALCHDLQRRDQRLRYIRQPVNAGPIENFRAVLRHATGTFFMWLSDDDWLAPNYLACCVAVLLTHPDFSAACGRGRFMEGDSVSFEEEPMDLLADSGAERVLSYFMSVRHNSVFYSVMRRKDLEKVPLRGEHGGDWLLMGAIACLGKVRTVSETFVNKSLGGISSNIDALVEVLGLPPHAATHPWLRLGYTIFLDISWRSAAYRGLGLRERVWLGIRAADAIWTRMPMPDWWWRYPIFRERMIRMCG